MNDARTYPRTLRQAWPDTHDYDWADPSVVRAVLQPLPAEAATEVGADQPQPMTVSLLQRWLRDLRIRRVSKGPKL